MGGVTAWRPSSVPVALAGGPGTPQPRDPQPHTRPTLRGRAFRGRLCGPGAGRGAGPGEPGLSLLLDPDPLPRCVVPAAPGPVLATGMLQAAHTGHCSTGRSGWGRQ